MRIAIIGAGAIGSVVAASLHKAGEDVVLIAKEEQAEAINKNGLQIKGVRAEETLKLKALSSLDQEYDLVIFATKTQDIEQAYQDNNEYLDNCLVMTTQNGVQADNLLSSHIERENLISSIVMFGSTFTRAGQVVFNFEGDWIIGKPYTKNDEKLAQVSKLLSKTFNIIESQNIMGMKWLKLFVNFNNCIPALVGKSMQETFADIELCKLSVRLLKEGLDVVQQANIELVDLPEFPLDRIYGLVSMPEEKAAGIINQTLTTLSKEPLYGSILQSIMRGKVSEIDFINGEVVAISKQTKVPAPLNTNVVDMVHEVERTNEYFSFDDIKQKFELTVNI